MELIAADFAAELSWTTDGHVDLARWYLIPVREVRRSKLRQLKCGMSAICPEFMTFRSLQADASMAFRMATLFNSDPQPVPMVGATVVLLGAALMGLAAFTRQTSKSLISAEKQKGAEQLLRSAPFLCFNPRPSTLGACLADCACRGCRHIHGVLPFKSVAGDTPAATMAVG